MKKNLSLHPESLAQKTNISHLKFKTTDEIKSDAQFVGHLRAVEAVRFSVGIKKDGYNLYAMGPSGVGKRVVVYAALEEEAQHQKVPSDWCYIHNFNNPEKPIAVKLPPGWGNKLRRDMQSLVEDLFISLPIVFESEEYHARVQKIADDLNSRQEKLLKQIKVDAEKKGLVIVASPEEFTILPADQKGRAISAEDFAKLDKKKRDEKEVLISIFSERLTNFLKNSSLLHKEQREKEKALKKKFTLMGVGHFIEELKEKYSKFKKVVRYLDAIQSDVIEHAQDFLKKDEAKQSAKANSTEEKASFAKYRVNVLVSHATTQGAPIVYETNPSYSNLICKIEHTAQYGTLSTDFTLIKPSALHKANGGYLIIDAIKLLQDLSAWEGLKRALYTRKIVLEPAESASGALTTISLEPMPIPLNVRVILLGDRSTYYLLCESDPDFSELFKVAADFDEYVERTPKNLQLYARFIATLIEQEKLRHFDNKAVAAVIDHSARLAEDAGRLSAHMGNIQDLLRESDYWASKTKESIVQAIHVKQAIAAKIYRLDRVREALYTDVLRGVILIDVKGAKIGQVNGLVVAQLGDFSFGHPCRISASIYLGDEGIVDIQRETEMGGTIHSKGVLILSGFLAGYYAKDTPLSLAASLVFEQTYSMVDGDSASVAELCALLSAISEVPLAQSLAVTGSVNQHGEVQAVGALNEKIEGFFDICKAMGLTGEQGVIIPAANQRHLMLKDELVAAVANKKFHIYAVRTIHEVIALLTGTPVGERGKNGKFPGGSVNEKVEQRLINFSRIKDGKRKSKRVVKIFPHHG